MKYLASHENTQRGSYEFPIALYYVDKNHPRYEMPFHWHMEYELMRILSGSFSLSVDGQIHILKKGDTAVISSGVVHGGVPTDCVYECLVFDTKHFMESSSALLHCKYCDFFNVGTVIQPFFEKETPCSTIIHQMFVSMEKKAIGYEFVTIGLIWQLFGQILNEHAYTVIDVPERKSDKSTDQMKTVLNYIRKNYASNLTLSDLADILNLSPEHFCRLFHSITGKSPIDYLNYYRIECACELLSSSQKSITEVAYSCGFNDLSYFNRIFKKYKRITPGRYQKLTLQVDHSNNSTSNTVSTASGNTGLGPRSANTISG